MKKNKKKKCPNCKKMEMFILSNEICDKCSNKLGNYLLITGRGVHLSFRRKAKQSNIPELGRLEFGNEEQIETIDKLTKVERVQ